jgi:hypothetical protein
MTEVTSRSFDVFAGIGIRILVLQLARDDDVVAQRAVIVADRLTLTDDESEVLDA